MYEDILIKSDNSVGISALLYNASRKKLGSEDQFDYYIEKVARLEDLSRHEASKAMELLMSGKVSDFQIGAFLTGLYKKDVNPVEIASFATTMRDFAEKIEPNVTGTIGDTCGTGGGLHTFNVSTTIMFIVAASEIPIAKHGNRAIASKCGSADVLEELGVNVELEPKNVEKCIEQIGIGFMFAPIFHKAMKHVQKVRRELPFRTVFNVLGPLTNPAHANSQIIGVYDEGLVTTVAEALLDLGMERAMVVYGVYDSGGLDEISTIGETKIAELTADKEIQTYTIKPEDFGLKTSRPDEIKGGMPPENARILKSILNGTEKGPKRDLALLNAAASIMVGGKCDNLAEGIEIAKDAIDSGDAYKKLEQLITLSNELSKSTR